MCRSVDAVLAPGGRRRAARPRASPSSGCRTPQVRECDGLRDPGGPGARQGERGSQRWPGRVVGGDAPQAVGAGVGGVQVQGVPAAVVVPVQLHGQVLVDLRPPDPPAGVLPVDLLALQDPLLQVGSVVSLNDDGGAALRGGRCGLQALVGGSVLQRLDRCGAVVPLDLLDVPRRVRSSGSTRLSR